MTSLHSLLSMDTAILHKPQGGVDDEGVPRMGIEEVGPVVGTWGSANGTDQQVAARREVILDAVYAGTFSAQEGWQVHGLRGSKWEITAYTPTRIHNRYFLRLLED